MNEKSALQQLKALHFDKWRERHPSMDQKFYAAPKFTDKTANGLTKCIISFLQFNSCQAERISSEGRVIDTRKTYTDSIGRVKTIGSIQRTYSSTTNGTADVSAIIQGLSVKVEIKVGKDVQSEAQKAYQEDVEKAGGIYTIAKGFESFVAWYNEFIEK